MIKLIIFSHAPTFILGNDHQIKNNLFWNFISSEIYYYLKSSYVWNSHYVISTKKARWKVITGQQLMPKNKENQTRIIQHRKAIKKLFGISVTRICPGFQRKDYCSIRLNPRVQRFQKLREISWSYRKDLVIIVFPFP